MVSFIREDEDELEEPRYADDLKEDYVFTYDNFIKMIMINMKMSARIPLIVMGETGCGKTSLIKALASLKKAEIIIFNIHAGIDNNKILEFVKENDLIDEDTNSFKRDYKKSQNIWVFFDEVNTSNSLGLFAEMMIKKTILGKLIKKNVSFIAACNPYKKSDDNTKKKDKVKSAGIEPGAILDQKKYKQLAYTVNPLPYSLLNFVFSFEHLEKNTEKKYISNMLEKSLTYQINYDQDIKILNAEQQKQKIEALKKDIVEPIFFAQNYVRDIKGVSSVSLRDINRFVHLFEWFLIKKREKFLIVSLEKDEFKEEENNKENDEKNDDDENIKEYNPNNDYIFAAILAIYVCYFLRLDTRKLREEMNKKMNEIFGLKDFEKFCQGVVHNLVNEIKIEKGIAKNRALLENLFTLFICINNKIPLFLCGKPGCSKSLSLSIIEKAMRGKKSISEKFKNIPEISRSTYQGSLSSTSEGVLNVFKNTRTKMKMNREKMEGDINQLKQQLIKMKKEWKKMTKYDNEKYEKERDILLKQKEIKESPTIDDYIFMIYFDEMGIAEISPNNPLKVIHSQLEYEKEEEKLAFVGISNWTLDASKMNRGIYLAVSEPDEIDCIETAIEIANSYDDNLGNEYKDFFTLLAQSYVKFVKETILKEHADFHGARDFYHVIKLTARILLEKKNNNENIIPLEIIRRSVQRNFGGYEGSVKRFEIEIQENDSSYKPSQSINITECIRESIIDIDSRYLMIISDTSRSQFLVQFLLQTINKESSFLLGSHFDSDLKSEKYTASILQRIQVSMKYGQIIVMNNLESIYPSLYDLFNQTLTEVCGRKYARITIGSSTDALFEVDKDFKCIVLVDPKKLDRQDRPFLNRFEKQVFSFENLLNENENEIALQIYELLKEGITPIIKEDSKKNIKIDISNHLVNFNLEEIRAIVYNNRNLNLEEIKNEIYQKMVPTFSQDIIVNMNYSSFSSKNPEEFKKIIEIYEKKPNNFEKFLETLKTKNQSKNIIFFSIV